MRIISSVNINYKCIALLILFVLQSEACSSDVNEHKRVILSEIRSLNGLGTEKLNLHGVVLRNTFGGRLELNRSPFPSSGVIISPNLVKDYSINYLMGHHIRNIILAETTEFIPPDKIQKPEFLNIPERLMKDLYYQNLLCSVIYRLISPKFYYFGRDNPTLLMTLADQRKDISCLSNTFAKVVSEGVDDYMWRD